MSLDGQLTGIAFIKYFISILKATAGNSIDTFMIHCIRHRRFVLVWCSAHNVKPNKVKGRQTNEYAETIEINRRSKLTFRVFCDVETIIFQFEKLTSSLLQIFLFLDPRELERVIF